MRNKTPNGRNKELITHHNILVEDVGVEMFDRTKRI
ncbi:hypothetical protein SAMN05421640_3191 [Ekhidna lutea]|uniref:Uncharacterized protein n=1 Tax=Ekhidna lutea TaxID=447679 RepID=A0A239LGI5_EKHLU|nr:hypothetical protein SAMN05421640_3191 [Ekhidna lutea]